MISAALLLLSGSLGLSVLVYHQSHQLLYNRLPYEVWIRQRPALCTPKRKRLVYADMRPGQKNPLQPLELSCEQARRLPATSGYALTQNGMRIYYRWYGQNAKQPVLLYVSGITSTWLDAVRYVPMAKRLGFQLVTMDLSNHGLSDNNGMGAAYGCREADDVLAVLQVIQQRLPGANVLLAGTSMGTMAIANAAARIPSVVSGLQLNAVALENPVSSLKHIMQWRAKDSWVPNLLLTATLRVAGWRTGYDFEYCSPLNQLKHLTYPTLVQTSAQDQLVPVSIAEEVYRALPTGYSHRFKVYPHGEHAAVWNGQPQEYEADLKAFWAENVKITGFRSSIPSD